MGIRTHPSKPDKMHLCMGSTSYPGFPPMSHQSGKVKLLNDVSLGGPTAQGQQRNRCWLMAWYVYNAWRRGVPRKQQSCSSKAQVQVFLESVVFPQPGNAPPPPVPQSQASPLKEKERKRDPVSVL